MECWYFGGTFCKNGKTNGLTTICEAVSGDSAGIRFFEFGRSLLVGNMLIYCDIVII